MSNRAVLYTRVSSDEQKKSGFSLDFQKKQEQEYAAKNGLEIIEIFEESHSAKKPGRPLFNKMIEYVQKNKIEHLIFFEK